MKVHPLRSIIAKLFILTIALVVLTVGGNSWQNSRYFNKFLTSQTEDTLRLQAKSAGATVDSVLTSQIDKLNLAIPNIRSTRPKYRKPLLENFVASHDEILSLQVLKKDPKKSLSSDGYFFTRNVKDERFEEKNPASISKKIQEINLKLGKGLLKSKEQVKVVSLMDSLKLPIMAIGIKYELSGGKGEIVAFTTMWLTQILTALPQSNSTSSYIVTKDGKTFLKGDGAPSVGSFKKSALFRSALVSKFPNGFLPEFKWGKNSKFLGSFMKLSAGDLFLLSQRDLKEAQLNIQYIIQRAALWGALFVLLAIFFSYFGSSTITKGIREITKMTQKIAMGDFGARVPFKSRDEVGLLANSVHLMSQKIQHLLKEQIEKVRMDKELETAKVVQDTFFPKHNETLEALSIAGFYKSASECGGDLWGHFKIDEDRSFVFIADAMGHGVPAALITAMAYSICMSEADNAANDNATMLKPSDLIHQLNRVISNAVNGNISMTFFGMIIDLKKGELSFSNAGHNIPFIIPAHEADDRAKKIPKWQQKISNIPVISLNSKGAPLGIDARSKYKDKTIALKPGDKLFLFTDGLIECESPEGEYWGKKGLIQHLLSYATNGYHEMLDKIVDDAYNFFDAVPQKDDVTVVVAEIAPNWQAGSQTESLLETNIDMEGALAARQG